MSVNSYCRNLRIAKEGLPYISAMIAADILFFKISVYLGLFSLVLTFFVVFFFRDPERAVRSSRGSVLSPADGRVAGTGRGTITIYLSLFDVHVTRSPTDGVVESVLYCPGKFRFAFDKRAPAENENNLINIVNGRAKIAVRQIAGKLARRIVCYCREKDVLRQGDRIGMIKFGSCVEVVLPENAEILVRPGERVKAGLTALAISER